MGYDNSARKGNLFISDLVSLFPRWQKTAEYNVRIFFSFFLLTRQAPLLLGSSRGKITWQETRCRAQLLISWWPGGERERWRSWVGESERGKRLRKRRVQRGEISFLDTRHDHALGRGTLGGGHFTSKPQHCDRSNKKTGPPFPRTMACWKQGSWLRGSRAVLLSSERSHRCSISGKSPGVKPALVGGANPVNLSGFCLSYCYSLLQHSPLMDRNTPFMTVANLQSFPGTFVSN